MAERVTITLALAALAFFPGAAFAADSTASPSPSPPPPAFVSAEDELSPQYYGEAGSSNVVNVRAQLPYDGGAYLLRIKLPIVTGAPPDSVTGAGDLAVWDFVSSATAHGDWLTGLNARFPTASDSLGSHKYSLGPAFGYTTTTAPWSYGFAQESYFSIVGSASYPGVAKTKISPNLRRILSAGWSVGLSTMQFTYDWNSNRWNDVPVGLRVEKRGIAGLAALDAYAEGERNLAHAPDTPGWTIRTALRWTFIPSP